MKVRQAFEEDDCLSESIHLAFGRRNAATFAIFLIHHAIDTWEYSTMFLLLALRRLYIFRYALFTLTSYLITQPTSIHLQQVGIR